MVLSVPFSSSSPSNTSTSSLQNSSYLPITTTNTTINHNATISTMAGSTSSNTLFVKQNYTAVCLGFILYSIIAGYMAGIQPTSVFRFFSYHPLLMTCSMIGMTSIAAITKKLGGYNNTKVCICKSSFFFCVTPNVVV
jgi:hypothetical protein